MDANTGTQPSAHTNTQRLAAQCVAPCLLLQRHGSELSRRTDKQTNAHKEKHAQSKDTQSLTHTHKETQLHTETNTDTETNTHAHTHRENQTRRNAHTHRRAHARKHRHTAKGAHQPSAQRLASQCVALCLLLQRHGSDQQKTK